jgi:hypothetical protein
MVQESKDLYDLELGFHLEEEPKPKKEDHPLYPVWLQELKRAGLEDDQHTER